MSITDRPVVERVNSQLNGPVTITITGPRGSGKTKTAKRIIHMLMYHGFEYEYHGNTENEHERLRGDHNLLTDGDLPQRFVVVDRDEKPPTRREALLEEWKALAESKNDPSRKEEADHVFLIWNEAMMFQKNGLGEIVFISEDGRKTYCKSAECKKTPPAEKELWIDLKGGELVAPPVPILHSIAGKDAADVEALQKAFAEFEAEGKPFTIPQGWKMSVPQEKGIADVWLSKKDFIHLFLAMDGKSSIKATGIPKDYRIIAVNTDWPSNSVILRMESREFAKVRDGDEVPRVNVEFAIEPIKEHMCVDCGWKGIAEDLKNPAKPTDESADAPIVR